MSLTESLKELWDAWNIKGLIILSLLVQSFLIFFAPLRKQRGGKWDIIRTGIWMAYLFADWVAIFTIGLILHAKSSDIQTFWAPFLLLHLGGPDAITSFSLEDNELWIRHLLGLLLQIGSTIYIFFLSLSNDNKLWLPTFLVLIAGIIKYAERNHGLYLASFDHFGNNWKEGNDGMPPVPRRFSMLFSSHKTDTSSDRNTREDPKPSLKKRFVKKFWSLVPFQAYFLKWPLPGKSSLEETTKDRKPTIEVGVYLFGILKSLLVGPPLISFGKFPLPNNLEEMLQAVEISLSLLYEFLHTKLPVVDSKIGYVCRIVNLGCVLGALVSFSLLKKHHYNLFDIWLTYGLLIGALVLDLVSIMFLISSDWITMAHYQEKTNSHKFIKKRRWSKSIPQLDIFSTCGHLKEEGGLANGDSFDILGLRSLFKKLRRTQWVKFELFETDQAWQFIFTTLEEFKLVQQKKDETGSGFNEWKKLLMGSLNSLFRSVDATYKLISSSLMNFGHMESLVMWHIVTEHCYREEDSDTSSSSAPSSPHNHRRICKLLSDYMFYLLVMEPSMIAISPNSWKTMFEGTGAITLKWLDGDLKNIAPVTLNIPHSVIIDTVEEIRGLFSNDDETKVKGISGVKMTVCKLVGALKNADDRWERMAKIWVCLLWYAAISSQSIVHARQVSKGGQLLTLVWLLINYMGLGSSPSGWFNSLLETDRPKD